MSNRFWEPETYQWMNGEKHVGNFTIDMNMSGEFVYIIDEKDVSKWIRSRLPGKYKAKRMIEEFFLQTEYDEYYLLKHTNCYSQNDNFWVKFDPKMKHQQVIFKNRLLEKIMDLYKSGWNIDTPIHITEAILKEQIRE